MWEGGCRTPALVHGPGLGLPRGEVSSLWLHVTDWFPTILAMAGLAPAHPEHLDGLNQWPQLLEPALAGDREEMIYNIFYPVFELQPSEAGPIAAIRRGDWKYIRRTVGWAGWTPCPPEACSNYTVTPGVDDVQDVLYNLAEDPSETVDLAMAEPGVAADLRMRLEEEIAALPPGYYPAEDTAGDPANFGGVWSDGWC